MLPTNLVFFTLFPNSTVVFPSLKLVRSTETLWHLFREVIGETSTSEKPAFTIGRYEKEDQTCDIQLGAAGPILCHYYTRQIELADFSGILKNNKTCKAIKTVCLIQLSFVTL
jgi:hypothetical protein